MSFDNLTENQKNLWYLNKALRELNPNAEYQATDIDNINWMNGTTPIPKEDIEAKITEIKERKLRAGLGKRWMALNSSELIPWALIIISESKK